MEKRMGSPIIFIFLFQLLSFVELSAALSTPTSKNRIPAPSKSCRDGDYPTPHSDTRTPEHHHEGETDTTKTSVNLGVTTRRNAILRGSSAAVFFGLNPLNDASAFSLSDLNPLVPEYRRSRGGYKPADRATSYFVDSTIPPTMIPLKTSTERNRLKSIAKGLGTLKKPLIDERLTLNNIANKGVFGTAEILVDVVDRIVGKTDDDKDIEDNSDDSEVTNEKLKKRRPYGPGYASFLFLGMNCSDTVDAELSVKILSEILRSRNRKREETVLALAYAPLSTQGVLDTYIGTGTATGVGKGDDGKAADRSLVEAIVQSGVDRGLVESQISIFRYARTNRLPLLACAPEIKDVQTVRTGGLQTLDADKRISYVADSQGFVTLTTDPSFRLYADRSLIRDFIPTSENDSVGDFFAERILVHEAVATSVSKFAMSRPGSLVVTVAPTADVRYLGGPNGRVPRVCRFLNRKSRVDDQAVTTILLNPTARTTLSKSRWMRLEIGTSPDNIQYQTKVADYLWFSTMPKISILSRMMNPI